MNTESPRLRALLAAGAALVVFGITIPATAAPDPVPGRPGIGTVGQAEENAHPPGQSIGEPDDENNGFRCDSNGGAGAGNPALGTCGASTDDTTQNEHPGNGVDKPGKGGNDNPGDGGTGSDGSPSGDSEAGDESPDGVSVPGASADT